MDLLGRSIKFAISLAGAAEAAEAGQRYPVRSWLQENILVWYGTGFPRRGCAELDAARRGGGTTLL